jgi:DHA1 family multidrug resistance protein-like MFS transporter
MGSAIVVNPNLGWRWTEYIEAIYVGFVVVLAYFAMPELFSPVILKRKAKATRKATGDERYWHPHESERIRPSNIVTKYLARPLRMLFTEPMVACVSSKTPRTF